MELVKKSAVTYKTLEPPALCFYIKEHPDAVLLDVRTKEEFEGKASPHSGTLKQQITSGTDVEKAVPVSHYVSEQNTGTIIFDATTMSSKDLSYTSNSTATGYFYSNGVLIS